MKNILIGKYEFNSEEQAKEKIEALGMETEEGYKPNNIDTIVELGFLVITPATYDDDGNMITPPVYSDKYHVDVLWQGVDSHPYGWATYSVNLNNEGVHSFFGVKYLDNKI